ncbi:PQQ-binding-like beta-propeller repeat protein [Gimesia aquarii]|uniref:Outer membrane biogenesis protein BamB n=1 Tax=Gimesia aquarii TaxID=2527964 RepID=A0A517VUW6_9PLAN|nr:PQQ-binding-like beta-propeller repeat protein [Gimesia aquarii]QDT96797.1 outer membrane biogenesis protein BamB [Gimesia aquarii]
MTDSVRWNKILRHLLLCFLVLLASDQITLGEDWPQWNGPRRDGSVHESELLTTIPSDGLKLVWRQPISFGYSGPIIADGKTFIFDYKKATGEITNNAGKRDKLTGKERLLCFHATTGKPLWSYEYERSYAVSYGGGPRATPSYHDEMVYALGAEGDLTCVDAKRGTKVWHINFKEQYGAKTPLWGHSASPLVYGNTLICMVGGEGSLVVAFDLKTGKEQWRALSSSETGYCPPTIVKHGGREQLMIWDPEQISSLNPTNGKLYWQHPLKPDYGMSILPPISNGDLLFTGGEGSKGVMLKLKRNASGVEKLWGGSPKRGVYLATSNGIFYEGYLYGADIRSGAVICARGDTGERLWQSALPTTGSTRGRGGAHGTAFLMKLSGHNYILFSETGDIISAELSPAGYRETGRFHAIKPTSNTMGRTVVWTFPAIADGRLYLRNDNEAVCYSLANDSTN